MGQTAFVTAPATECHGDEALFLPQPRGMVCEFFFPPTDRRVGKQIGVAYNRTIWFLLYWRLRDGLGIVRPHRLVSLRWLCALLHRPDRLPSPREVCRDRLFLSMGVAAVLFRFPDLFRFHIPDSDIQSPADLKQYQLRVPIGLSVCRCLLWVATSMAVLFLGSGTVRIWRSRAGIRKIIFRKP